MSEPEAHPQAPGPTVAGLEIKDIGVLPEVVAQINELADQPSTTAEDVGALILRDPTMTTKVLRITNSSYYGLRTEVRSIPHAVAYLGINQVRNLVISSALIEAFRFEHGVIEPRGLWEHSLACAIGAKELARALPALSGETAYLGGLLHDLGRIVLMANFPEEFAKAVDNCERGLCTLRQAEESHFGLSHEAAGHTVCQAWDFPEAVLAIVRHHHHPHAAGPFAPLAAVVQFANATCHEMKLRFGFELDDEHAREEKDRAWEVLVETYDGPFPVGRDVADHAVADAVGRTRELVREIF